MPASQNEIGIFIPEIGGYDRNQVQKVLSAMPMPMPERVIYNQFMSILAAGLLEHCCAGHSLEDVVRVGS